jgi:hypothetical protein
MHEGAPSVIHAMAGGRTVASWFDEGLAELAECWDLRAMLAKRADLRRGRWANEQMLKRGADGWQANAPSLSKLLKIEQWNADDMGQQTCYRYALAWNFMEFLHSTRHGRDTLRKMLERLIAGEQTLLTDRECLALEAHWHGFLKQTLAKRP